LTTKTEAKTVKSILFIVKIVVLSAIAVAFSVCLVAALMNNNIADFILGIASCLLVQLISKEISLFRTRDRIFPYLASVIKKGSPTIDQFVAVMSDHYKYPVDKFMMKVVFIVSGRKKDYKNAKMKIRLYRIALDKNIR